MAAIWTVDEILEEVKRDKKQLPVLPDHVMARTALVSERAGELTCAGRNHKYEASSKADKEQWKLVMRRKAIETAAACIRFIEGLKDLK